MLPSQKTVCNWESVNNIMNNLCVYLDVSLCLSVLAWMSKMLAKDFSVCPQYANMTFGEPKTNIMTWYAYFFVVLSPWQNRWQMTVTRLNLLSHLCSRAWTVPPECVSSSRERMTGWWWCRRCVCLWEMTSGSLKGDSVSTWQLRHTALWGDIMIGRPTQLSQLLSQCSLADLNGRFPERIVFL